jgi:hypothetical protein
MMHSNGNSWLISDVYLDGAISEVAPRHSEFAAFLKKDRQDAELLINIANQPREDYKAEQ